MSLIASQIASLAIVYSTFLFKRISKKTPKLRVTGLCAGIRRWPVNSPHKRPVTRKMYPFDDVIIGVSNPIHRYSIRLLCFYYNLHSTASKAPCICKHQQLYYILFIYTYIQIFFRLVFVYIIKSFKNRWNKFDMKYSRRIKLNCVYDIPYET